MTEYRYVLKINKGKKKKRKQYSKIAFFKNYNLLRITHGIAPSWDMCRGKKLFPRIHNNGGKDYIYWEDQRTYSDISDICDICVVCEHAFDSANRIMRQLEMYAKRKRLLKCAKSIRAQYEFAQSLKIRDISSDIISLITEYSGGLWLKWVD